jgi:hypothetical protein
MDVDGVRVLVQSFGKVVRVSDGKVLMENFASSAKVGSIEAGTDDSRNLVFAAPDKGKLAAWRFTRQGDAVTATEVWRAAAESSHTMAVAQGKIYTATHVVDIETGAVKNFAGRGFTRWLIAFADNRIYGLKADQSSTNKAGLMTRPGIHPKVKDAALMTVCDLNGRGLAQNPLFIPLPDEERAKQRQAMMGASTRPEDACPGDNWMFSYSCPFTFAGSRVFIRSLDSLYCIGEK